VLAPRGYFSSPRGVVSPSAGWKKSSANPSSTSAPPPSALCVVAYGRKLRGQLPPGAFRVSRGLLSVPFGLGLAYFGPAIEHFGIWWALLLPHLTYGALDSAGLGHWPALALTVVAAPVELLVTMLVSQAVIVSPLSAILGPDNPVVEAVRDLVGGIRVVEYGPLPAAGSTSRRSGPATTRPADSTVHRPVPRDP
jgi:hypothetical protein